jgi:SAM-dependent methyltransferase
MNSYKCSICADIGPHNTFNVKEMMFGIREFFTYLQCSNCGCLQLLDPPKNLEIYYPNEYYSYIAEHSKNKLATWVKFVVKKYTISNNNLISRFLLNRRPSSVLNTLFKIPLNKKSRILDVGCGAGVLLFDLKESGFNNVMGVDPFINETIKYKNGLVIKKIFLDEVTREWDLIMFNHSFEHLPDPLSTLTSAHKLLKPGGYCLIRVPVADSYAWNHYRENWVQLDAPRHINLFTTKSIKYLAEKVGLDLKIEISDSTSFQFWGSEQYLNNIPLNNEQSYASNPSKSIFSKRQIKKFEHQSNELNKKNVGDTKAFFLFKPSNCPNT